MEIDPLYGEKSMMMSLNRSRFILSTLLTIIHQSIDNFAIITLEAFSLWKVRKKLTEIQVPKIMCIFRCVISSNAPGYSKLRHVEVHNILERRIALKSFGMILNKCFKFLDRDLLMSDLA